MLDIGMPAERAPVPQQPEVAPMSVEDRVRDALDCIDSGHNSNVEWVMINRLYKNLVQKRGKNKRIDNLLAMIEPVMAKYGYHKVSSEG
jgi:hypothetical protein